MANNDSNPIYRNPELLKAQRDNELTLFVGAGVSRCRPALLPDLNALLRELWEEFGITHIEPAYDGDDCVDVLKSIDTIISYCKDEWTVKNAVRRIYSKHVPPSFLHTCLTRIFTEDQDIRIVTTNYDRLLSNEAMKYFHAKPDDQKYPDLTIEPGRLLKGIAYLHGSVESDASDLVLTINDFTKAYWSDTPIATNFLKGVLRKGHMLFVGYSLKDPILPYLIKACGDRKRMHAICLNYDIGAWSTYDVTPVPYRAEEGPDKFKHLVAGIHEWAEDIQGAEIILEEQVHPSYEAVPRKIEGDLHRSDVE